MQPFSSLFNFSAKIIHEFSFSAIQKQIFQTNLIILKKMLAIYLRSSLKVVTGSILWVAAPPSVDQSIFDEMLFPTRNEREGKQKGAVQLDQMLRRGLIQSEEWGREAVHGTPPLAKNATDWARIHKTVRFETMKGSGALPFCFVQFLSLSCTFFASRSLYLIVPGPAIPLTLV